MDLPPVDLFCMACGWSGDRAPAGCPACGATAVATVRAGALVTIPPSAWACDSCGASARPLSFRGTTRVGSIVWFFRVRQVSGYWCEPCARKKTAMTYDNWRAVWRPPRRPLKWGAVPIEAVAAAIEEERAARKDGLWSAFDDDAAAETTR